MSIKFKIWDQGHDSRTIGVRVLNVDELDRLASCCDKRSIDGVWENLQEYLDAAKIAKEEAPVPFSRKVNVVWINPVGYSSPTTFENRIFMVIRTGNERESGGFASQGYIIHDEKGYNLLKDYIHTEFDVEYISSERIDTVVIK